MLTSLTTDLLTILFDAYHFDKIIIGIHGKAYGREHTNSYVYLFFLSFLFYLLSSFSSDDENKNGVVAALVPHSGST